MGLILRLRPDSFCRICDIHSFFRPRSHPDKFYVTVCCPALDAQSRSCIVSVGSVSWEQNRLLLGRESNSGGENRSEKMKALKGEAFKDGDRIEVRQG
jgi:hypothetical protein